MNHTDIQFTFIMFNMKSFIIHAGDIQWPMYILLIWQCIEAPFEPL